MKYKITKPRDVSLSTSQRKVAILTGEHIISMNYNGAKHLRNGKSCGPKRTAGSKSKNKCQLTRRQTLIKGVKEECRKWYTIIDTIIKTVFTFEKRKK